VKKIIALIFVLALASTSALAQQEKGVDSQNQGIRDQGNSRAPANNGAKQDNGAGRGMDFGKGRTPAPPPIPNPYRFSVRRDAVMMAAEELMRDRKFVLDTAASKPEEGILTSQPYTFTKGAVVATSELGRYGEITDASARYILMVEAQPIDGNSTNVSVNIKLEGRSDGISGAEWTTLKSTGIAEEEFLHALIEKITGAPPPGREPSPQ
jgi:hypothetical protein